MSQTPTEFVVYILGAGFSAPLGLPVMGNFLSKARDQFFADPITFSHFKPVFKQIDDLARVRKAYRADLHNIEEVFSMLEMRSALTNSSRLVRGFSQFICDVIKFHTPPVKGYPGRLPGNWHDFVFGNRTHVPNDHHYGAFVASLLRLELAEVQGGNADDGGRFVVTHGASNTTSYAVVSLNYDEVLEQYAAHLSRRIGIPLSFEFDFCRNGSAWGGGCKIAKLHGDAGKGDVVPPTWSKGINNNIIKTWRLAHGLLAQATQIRVLGYSLAESDLYVRYLLKASALRSDRLKAIDVVCLDSADVVKSRYRNLIEHPGLRFANEDVVSYLKGITPRKVTGGVGPLSCAWGTLERAHEATMRAAS